MRIMLATLVLAFFVSTSHAQSDQQLVDRYDRFVSKENYKGALIAAQSIVERYPESATWQFNLGSMQSRLGEIDAALTSLGEAAELGFTGIRSFEQSQDLDPLRDDDRFKSIVRKVQSNAAERLNGFIREAKDHKPQTHVPDSVGESPGLILALHGTGMRGEDMIGSLQQTADELGMILIAPDALRPSGKGFSWTYRDESEWMVQDQIRKALDEHGADPEQVYLVGFSQGANIALIMGRTHPSLFAGVIPICGHYESQFSSGEEYADYPPHYLMTGARDAWKKTYITAKRDFTSAGIPVEVRMISGKGHEIPQGKLGLREMVKAIRWCESQSKDEGSEPTDDTEDQDG
jgi:predicted esterase